MKHFNCKLNQLKIKFKLEMLNYTCGARDLINIFQ